LSNAPIFPTVTTLGPAGLCGATLGRYRQPNPSADISNSTNGGKVAVPCVARKSLGVVIETNVFTRVRGTGPPGLRWGGLVSIESIGIQDSGSPRRRKSLSKKVRIEHNDIAVTKVQENKIQLYAKDSNIVAFSLSFWSPILCGEVVFVGKQEMQTKLLLRNRVLGPPSSG